MSTTNNCNFVGRVIGLKINQANDPKNSAVNFGLAVRRNFKNKEGKYEDDVVPCTMFGQGRYDYLSKYLAKNGKVSVNGEFRQRVVEKDGQKHYYYSIAVSDIAILDFADNGNSTASTASPTPSTSQADLDLGSIELEGGELPF